MESREKLGLPNVELFDDGIFSHTLGDNFVSQGVDAASDMQEDYDISPRQGDFSSLFAGSALPGNMEKNIYHGLDSSREGNGQFNLAPQPEDHKFQAMNTTDGLDEDYGLIINPDDMLVPLPQVHSKNEDLGAVINPNEVLVSLSEFQPAIQTTPRGLAVNPNNMLVPLSKHQPGAQSTPQHLAINSNDVLVPHSKSQPAVQSTSQGLGTNPLSSSTVPPKIIVSRKVVVPKRSIIKCKGPACQSQVLSVLSKAAANANVQSVELVPYEAPAAAANDASTFDADSLINEAVEMIRNKTQEDYAMNSCLDTSMFEGEMEDLLSQLETIKYSQLEASDVSSWSSEPVSPASLPSPVPSAGSLSPQPCGDYLYPSSIQSSDGNEKNTSAILSPSSVRDDYMTPINSPAESVEDSCDEGCQSIVHSYSRTPGKIKGKASRKAASSRGATTRETKRERKKEQNKQAALRYRHKKKLEDNELQAQIDAEEERQQQLKAKYSNLKQELTYLKKIMREVFIAKGVVSADAFKKKK